jgi:hypothetical protein
MRERGQRSVCRPGGLSSARMQVGTGDRTITHEKQFGALPQCARVHSRGSCAAVVVVSSWKSSSFGTHCGGRAQKPRGRRNRPGGFCFCPRGTTGRTLITRFQRSLRHGDKQTALDGNLRLSSLSLLWRGGKGAHPCTLRKSLFRGRYNHPLWIVSIKPSRTSCLQSLSTSHMSGSWHLDGRTVMACMSRLIV